MLNLSSLIAALQTAAQEASATVATEQVKLLQRFFHGLDLDGGPHESSPEPLRPVMVRMGFPRETEDGPEEHIVYVPLVTLAPLSSLQMTEMEVEVGLDAVSQEDSLLVGFVPHHSEHDPERESRSGNLKIRIKFGASGQPEGMQLIVDGYAKALRAQIPN